MHRTWLRGVVVTEEIKSKSQNKRDAEVLKDFGSELVQMRTEMLDRLPLTDPLRKAIVEAKNLKSHGAVRRQVQWIGKLLRLTDHAGIQDAYQALLAEGSTKTAAFHTLETWRTRLVEQGNDALTEFVALYQPTEIQLLRQLIKKARDMQNTEHFAAANLALFRHLRSHIQ